MVDYTTPTGAGTMMIRDLGLQIQFWIQAGSSSTFVGSLPWSGEVNGVTVGGSFNYPTGAPWVLVASYDVTVTQTVRFSIGASGTSGLGGPTDFYQNIFRATVPTAPKNLRITSQTPTQVVLAWDNPDSDGGAGIDLYLVRYWPNSSPSGSYVEHSQELNNARTVNGLTPGQYYTFAVYAHNSVGYSAPSNYITVRMSGIMWVKVDGVYRQAIPYVKIDGVYRQAIPYVKIDGTYRISG